jgi:hypothetical protein
MLFISSDEAKPVVEDKLSEVASALISAYDSGELGQALAEGDDGWKKWVKSFGKTHKRKVSLDDGNCGLLSASASTRIRNFFQNLPTSIT